MPDADRFADDHPNLTALLHEISAQVRIQQPTSHYEPDEPRDVKMAAQIKATLLSGGADHSQPTPGTPEYATAQLIGIPVEEVARQVNLQWLAQVTELIQISQENDPRFGTPDDWTVVCSDHLFEHWAAIEGIQVLHSPLPPWSIYLVRSTAWWVRQLENEPLRFAYDPPRDATLLPFPTRSPEGGPSDGSQN